MELHVLRYFFGGCQGGECHLHSAANAYFPAVHDLLLNASVMMRENSAMRWV
nr:hypothetical protein [uncultured Agathobaculum sp.]